jgi:hypothetical protein
MGLEKHGILTNWRLKMTKRKVSPAEPAWNEDAPPWKEEAQPVVDVEKVSMATTLIELLAALRGIFPLAEAHVAGAPGHPDQSKLEDARAMIAKCSEFKCSE